VGIELDWSVNDDVKLSFGGGYREANTYVFNIDNAGSDTQSLHLSTTISYGSWSAGVEYGNGRSDGLLGAPTLGTHALLVDAAYAVNSNLQLSAGWQKLNYSRNAGVFYNGAPIISMDAGFLHAVLNI
jgi:hypothetical protein